MCQGRCKGDCVDKCLEVYCVKIGDACGNEKEVVKCDWEGEVKIETPTYLGFSLVWVYFCGFVKAKVERVEEQSMLLLATSWPISRSG